jgi:protocatechuate 3,4-dioxygenase beta subunit
LLAAKTKMVIALLVALGLAVGTFTYGALAARPAAAPPAKAPTPRADARAADKDGAVQIKGRVLNSEGKPLAGASVFLLSEAVKIKAGAPARATTDKDGHFHFTASRDELEQGGKVAATAKDHGPDWLELNDPNKAGEITLRLVPDDVPINGRVLDLEGRPVAGVRVRAARLMRGDLKAWLDGTLAHRYPQLPERIGPEILGESVTAVTGKDGRFRLSGFGRDRVVHVLLEGDNIERGDFEVVTRPEVPRGLSKGNNGVYPARFDHLAGPGKSITGTIRDKRTGKPIAGISVACPFTPSWIWATTDEQGRYRLTGVAKRKEYWVAAGGLPYFNCTKMGIGDTPGMELVTVDFALERGIAVRGKLINKVTGKPIRGRVNYVVLPDNRNLKDFTDVSKPQALASDPGRTKADGSFAVVAVPGRGMLAATADDEQQYLRADVEDPKPQGGLILEQYHAMIHIDPSEEDAKSTVSDIALEPARTRKGTVVGPDGKPLTGAHFAGLSGIVQLRFGRTETMETASFTAGGLAPKGSRNLVFVHAEKKLAKVQKVRGDERGPLTVRLEPLGTLAGRILDADGRPRAGLKVAVMLSVEHEDYKELPLDLLYDYPAWSKVLNREAMTDAEGCFRVEGLVPGLKYLVNVKNDGTIVKSLTRRVDAIESGKTKDLGDLKSK